MSDDPSDRWQRVREATRAASDGARKLVDSAGRALQESKAWERSRSAAERATEVAERAKKSATELADLGQQVLMAVMQAPDDAGDKARAIERFITAIGPVAKQLDEQADAYVVGQASAAGAGLGALTGIEIVYVRAGAGRAVLRVSALEGRSARLAVGVTGAAYCGCMYGDRDGLARPTTRRGGDAGLILASLALLEVRSDALEEPAKAWLLGLSSGLDVGIPILGDIAAVTIDEDVLALHALQDEDVQAIEAALTETRDRPWLRQAATTFRVPFSESSEP